MAKSDRIVTRLESEMRARLHAKASAIGLDDAAYVRMLIYRDINEVTQPVAQARGRSHLVATDTPRAPIAFGGTVQAETGGHFDLEEPEPLPVEEMDIPADADGGDPGALDELLAAGPSILDEMLALSVPNPAAHGTPARSSSQSRAVTTRGYRAPLSRRPGAQPAYGPGSMTRPVGLNEAAVGYMGDSPNSVLRTNMGHFGIAATRVK